MVQYALFLCACAVHDFEVDELQERVVADVSRCFLAKFNVVKVPILLAAHRGRGFLEEQEYTGQGTNVH